MPKVAVQSVYSLVGSLAKGTIEYAAPGLDADFRNLASGVIQRGIENLGIMGPAKEAKNPKDMNPQNIFFQK